MYLFFQKFEDISIWHLKNHIRITYCGFQRLRWMWYRPSQPCERVIFGRQICVIFPAIAHPRVGIIELKSSYLQKRTELRMWFFKCQIDMSSNFRKNRHMVWWGAWGGAVWPYTYCRSKLRWFLALRDRSRTHGAPPGAPPYHMTIFSKIWSYI